MKEVILVVIFCFINGTAALGVQYTITDLGTLGGQWTQAIALNDNGQVTGNSQDLNGYQHAFFWSSGQMTSIGTFGGRHCCGYDINNDGVVVGWANSEYGYDMFAQQLPFKYENGVLTQIGSFPMPRNGRALAINDIGQIALWGDIDNNNNRASFLYYNGVINSLEGSFNPYPCAINNIGQVLGYDGTLNQNGQVTCVSIPVGRKNVYCMDINNSGKVVGESEAISSNSPTHAYLWVSPNNPIDIGTFAPMSNTRANAINNSDQIVGILGTRAALWGNNTIYDLNSMVHLDFPWVLTEAVDINVSGQILCNGFWAGTVEHAFLLTPVPEPSGLLAFCGGVAGLLAFRRRRH